MTNRFSRSVRDAFSSPVRLSVSLMLALVIASGFYIQWRHSRIPRGAATEPDTMCVASRLGLPCSP